MSVYLSWEKELKAKKGTIDILKQIVIDKHPDLTEVKKLKDGSLFDDLFFLRYVLSSKQPLDSENEIKESKTLEHILECLDKKHYGTCIEELDTSKRASLLSTIPLMKTGELDDGTPVLYLPVKDVDLGLVSKTKGDKVFRQNLLDLLLSQRASVYSELDKKTRESGRIIKAITVYDLNGMSFKDLYKFKSFFELLQTQGKLFKVLFPQSTLVSVFVNSPGSFFLKSFMTSKKQKIMSCNKFLETYKAYNATPDLIGGCFIWPRSKEQLLKLNENGNNLEILKRNVEDLNFKEVNKKVISFNNNKSNRNIKKINLKELEKQMIKLNKNRLFSITVLEPNQRVNVLFTNMKKKYANVLVEIKQEHQNYKKTLKIPNGFVTIPFNLQTKGEIIFTYVDQNKISIFNKQLSIESINLKRNKAKAIVRKTKKFTKKQINSFKTSKLDKALRNMDYAAVRKYQQMEQLKRMGIAEKDKVFFRFEITDSIICGQYGGEQQITDNQIKQFEQLPSAPVETVEIEDNLQAFEGRSLVSTDSLEMRERELNYSSFFGTAAGILFKGW